MGKGNLRKRGRREEEESPYLGRRLTLALRDEPKQRLRRRLEEEGKAKRIKWFHTKKWLCVSFSIQN